MVKMWHYFRLTVPEPGMMHRELSGVSAATSCPNGPVGQAGELGSTNSMPRRARSGTDSKKSGPTPLFILSETNIVRRMTKFLIEWPPFEYTVLVKISYYSLY